MSTNNDTPRLKNWRELLAWLDDTKYDREFPFVATLLRSTRLGCMTKRWSSRETEFYLTEGLASHMLTNRFTHEPTVDSIVEDLKFHNDRLRESGCVGLEDWTYDGKDLEHGMWDRLRKYIDKWNQSHPESPKPIPDWKYCAVATPPKDVVEQERTDHNWAVESFWVHAGRGDCAYVDAVGNPYLFVGVENDGVWFGGVGNYSYTVTDLAPEECAALVLKIKYAAPVWNLSCPAARRVIHRDIQFDF